MARTVDSDPKKENVSGAFPNTQSINAGALEVKLSDDIINLFNPNAALSAVNTYISLNNTVNKLFGIEARWFRAVPQQRAKDIIFKEYTLSNVAEDPLCLKVLVPDGNFPDNQYNYDLMGLEYEIPLSIHIDKKYWEEIAGFGTAPQRKDIVYLTLPNKLYQIESSFLDRGFMQQETTWIVNLRKYMTESSRRESDDLKKTIDKYTVSEEEIFGEALDLEYSKNKNEKQFSPFNSTERDEYKILDKDLKIISQNIDIYGLIAAESFYDMSTSSVDTAVTYIGADNLVKDSDRGITAWVYHRIYTGKIFDVTSIEKDLTITSPANYKIKIAISTRLEIGYVFVISRPGALNFYATVIDDTEKVDGIYYCKIEKEVEEHLANIKTDWYNARNYKMRLQPPITILNGINTTETGLRVKVYSNQYVQIDYGTQTYVVALEKKLNDEEWYGFVINIGNTWSQYSVYVWEKHTSDREQKIRIRDYKTMIFTPEITTVDNYTLNKSNSYITNIRLFNTTIEEEKQAQELLSYFSKDSDQAIILDNCDPRFHAPYISKQR